MSFGDYGAVAGFAKEGQYYDYGFNPDADIVGYYKAWRNSSTQIVEITKNGVKTVQPLGNIIYTEVIGVDGLLGTSLVAANFTLALTGTLAFVAVTAFVTQWRLRAPVIWTFESQLFLHDSVPTSREVLVFNPEWQLLPPISAASSI